MHFVNVFFILGRLTLKVYEEKEDELWTTVHKLAY